MKNAKRLLRKLDYLPRWAWYAMSLAIGGPVGPVVVYVAFHALQKAADFPNQQTHKCLGLRILGRGGGGATCLMDRLIRPAWSMPMTLTLTSCPSFR